MLMKNEKISVGKILDKYSIFFILLVMVVISTIINSNFLSIGNITNLGRQLAVATILAYGAMVLIISGMIDLSSGSVLALAGVISVSVYKATGSLFIAFLTSIAVAVFCNLINAVMVANFKTPPFIATLAMMTMARGAALLYTGGQNILQIGGYRVFGHGKIIGIPIPIIFMIVITVAIYYVLKHTKFGRSCYAIGGNEDSAIAAGINVKQAKYKAFILNGILVGIAGVLFMARVNSGLPNGAVGYEMEGLTATIVGGTSFSGGIGSPIGTLAGSFIIGSLNNIMNLVGVESYIQQITKGAIIALAVIYDIKSKNKRVKIK